MDTFSTEQTKLQSQPHTARIIAPHGFCAWCGRAQTNNASAPTIEHGGGLSLTTAKQLGEAKQARDDSTKAMYGDDLVNTNLSSKAWGVHK